MNARDRFIKDCQPDDLGEWVLPAHAHDLLVAKGWTLTPPAPRRFLAVRLLSVNEWAVKDTTVKSYVARFPLWIHPDPGGAAKAEAERLNGGDYA